MLDSSSPLAPRGSTAVGVYMASRHGGREEFTIDARAVAAALAARRCDLVYGGGSVGLMGEVANTMLQSGARVTGVITQHLYEREVAHAQLTELVVVPDMPARKEAMFQRSDAFVILPGGVGTMEEFFEVWCWSSLGLHHKPIGLLNTEGYYDQLLGFLQRSVDDGLTRAAAQDLLIVDENPNRLVDRILDGIDAVGRRVSGMAQTP